MKSIKFSCYIDIYAEGENGQSMGKIAPIKALRTATDLGLKESKDLVESASGCTSTWVMTSEQFGLWMAESIRVNKTCVPMDQGIRISNVEIVNSYVSHDFTIG